MPPAPRSRPVYALLAAVTVALGLASRIDTAAIPGPVRAYAGDALYATLVYLLIALLRTRVAPRRVALATWLVCAAIELSQLYRAGWLDAIRATTPGALVLGRGFVWTDLVCYAGGALIALAIDTAAMRRGA